MNGFINLFITDIRTATPSLTCSKISDLPISSATSLSISIPLFIGPGCITKAFFFALFNFSPSNPQNLKNSFS